MKPDMKNSLLILVIAFLSCQQATVITSTDTSSTAPYPSSQRISHMDEDDLAGELQAAKPAAKQTVLSWSETLPYRSASICKATVY